MKHFKIKQDDLYAEAVPLSNIAKTVGTPCYVYSRAAIEEAWRAIESGLQRYWSPRPFQIHYAVKANSNLAVLNVLADLGSGFDIVSEGELARVLKAGGKPSHIVFSGVGKRIGELKTAIEKNVGVIQIESEAELHRLQKIASDLKQTVAVAIRVNPDVETDTHPYITTGHNENKFGVDIETAKKLCQTTIQLPHVTLQGIAFHIGSQIKSLKPFLSALEKILKLLRELKSLNIEISDLNIGGGLGVSYRPEESVISIETYLNTICEYLKDFNFRLHLEPGRAIVAEAGVLLTTVEYIKPAHFSPQGPHFAIVDAGMNDLIRPALYQAWHEIVPIKTGEHQKSKEKRAYHVVGPLCESGDFLGKDRVLAINPGDTLAILKTGAYGFSMSSHYNSRPKPAEVMVDQDQFHLVRTRESIADLYANESLLS